MWFALSALPAAAEVARTFLPIEALSWEVTVTGPVARLQVTERFRNTGRDAVDAVLVAPLEPGGAVTGLRLTIGTRVIEGTLAGRAEARAAYEAARDDGRTAALTEEVRPDVFTLDVANLPPGEPVEVRLTILQPVSRRPDGWQLRLPADAPPRLLPLGSAPVVPRIGVDERDVGVRARVDFTLQAGVPLRALSGPAPDVLGSAGRLALRDLPLGEAVTIGWRTGRTARVVGLLVSDTHALVAVEGAGGPVDDAGCPLVDAVRLPAADGAWFLLGRRAGPCERIAVDGAVAGAVPAIDPRALGAIWARGRLPALEAAGDLAAVRELGLTWGLVTSQTSLVAIDPLAPRPSPRRSVGWAPLGSKAGGLGALGSDAAKDDEDAVVFEEIELLEAEPRRSAREDRPARPVRDAEPSAGDEPPPPPKAAPPAAVEPSVALGDERRTEAIDALQRLLAEGVPDEARGDLMFRLAALYANLEAPEAWEKAAHLFRAVATTYPRSPHAAEAWYRLAEVLRRLGRDDDAEAALATLRSRYPGSPFAR